jgi:hypothetical protein
MAKGRGGPVFLPCDEGALHGTAQAAFARIFPHSLQPFSSTIAVSSPRISISYVPFPAVDHFLTLIPPLIFMYEQNLGKMNLSRSSSLVLLSSFRFTFSLSYSPFLPLSRILIRCMIIVSWACRLFISLVEEILGACITAY